MAAWRATRFACARSARHMSDWFYWYFRVRGAAGRTHLRVHLSNVIGARGPAVSTDGGQTWSWLGAGAVRGSSFRYAFPADADGALLPAMPYVQATWTRSSASTRQPRALARYPLPHRQGPRGGAAPRRRLDGQAAHKASHLPTPLLRDDGSYAWRSSRRSRIRRTAVAARAGRFLVVPFIDGTAWRTATRERTASA